MLEHQHFLIRERVALLETVDTYDILDPASQQPLGIAVEKVGRLNRRLRWIIGKQFLPTRIEVREGSDQCLVFIIQRPVRLWRDRVRVLDADENPVGYFQTKLFTPTSGFWVFDRYGKPFAEVRGDWKAWNFAFFDAEGRELGSVRKQWAGFGREAFTSADHYLVSVADHLAERPLGKMLILATALAVDVVYKE